MNQTLLKSIKLAPEILKRRWARCDHSASEVWWYMTIRTTSVWLHVPAGVSHKYPGTIEKSIGPSPMPSGDDGNNELRRVPELFEFHACQVPYQGMEPGTVDWLLHHGAIVPTNPVSWARRFESEETQKAVLDLMDESGKEFWEEQYRQERLLRRLEEMKQ